MSGTGERGAGTQRIPTRVTAGRGALVRPRRTAPRLHALPSSLALLAVLAGCSSSKSGPPPIPLWTDDFAITVSSDPVPPRALERVKYKVVVQDKKTHQPIDGGEGRIFATNRDRKSIDNGLVKGPEVGTYYTDLFFVTAGEWAMGVQFRRDSTQRLQRTNDWIQEVRAATGPGQ